MKKLSLVVALLGALLATAFGQDPTYGNFLQTRIPFEFVAGGQTLPAGLYDFSLDNSTGRVRLRNHVASKDALQLLVMTRIAADNTTDGTARISFDVQDGKHFIEAIWPAQSDGYLLHTVKGEHTHEIIRMK